MLAAQVCPACSDTGWVPLEGSNRARACACQAAGRRQQRISTAKIPQRYVDHCTLADFHDRGNDSLRSAKRRVQDFIDLWPAADRGLLMMGACGVGKTHLAVAVLHEIIRQGKPGRLLFTNFQDLIQEIHASFTSDQMPSKDQILDPVLAADLLVLDELGSQKATAFVQDMLYYIINSRYNAKRVTIFTTNYLDESRRGEEETLQGRIGVRLRSRLFEMAEKVVIESGDYRQEVARRRV